jgi:hypothetical protein
MDRRTFESKRRSIETPSGRVSYIEYGTVHSVALLRSIDAQNPNRSLILCPHLSCHREPPNVTFQYRNHPFPGFL